jgi:ribosomal-protein-alanine N-acetyltransferase
MITGMTKVVPTLGAEGCVLRPFRHDDLRLVLEASRDPSIPQITSVPTEATTQQARDWITLQHTRVTDGIGYPFVIAAADNDEPLGPIGIWHHDVGPGRARIGYWVVAHHRRQRVAGRALAALASWGLTLPGIVRLELYVEPWNEGSWRAAESAGFRREGLLRSWELVGSERRDMFMYSRLSTDPG